MGKILCYIYENMADFEITLLLHRLHMMGGRTVVAVSENMAAVTAQSGLQFLPDANIGDITDIDAYDALLIPGGPINPAQDAICPLIRAFLAQDKLVAAICFAPQFPGRAGVLEQYKFTTSCSAEHIRQCGYPDPFNWDNYVEARCVQDRNLITAKGHAFVDFAERVCAYLNIFADEEQCHEAFASIKGED